MNKKIFLAVTIMVFSLLSSNLYAQTVYSLYDLCKIADKTSRKIKIARDNLYISELDKKRAIAVLMPRLTAFGTKNRNFRKFDDPIAITKMDGITDTETLGLQLDQSFTLNGKELIAFKVTKDQIEKNEYELESTRSDYLFAVAQIYYRILSAEKNLDISKAGVKRLLKHKNSVKEKLDVGTVAKTALFRAEAEHSKAKTNLLISENELNFAKASLKNLVDIEDNFSLIEEKYFYLKGFELSFENLIKSALKNRPEIKSIEKNQDIAEKTIRYEQGDYWPVLSIKGVYSNSEIISEYDSNYSIYDNETNVINKSIEAKLEFTIFDGGLRRAEIRQAIARKRQADAILIDVKNNIVLESKNAWFDFQTAKSSIETLKDELKSAKENLNAVAMQFEYGLSDSVDMMDADTLFVSAQRELAHAEYTYELSIINLIRIKGELLNLLL